MEVIKYEVVVNDKTKKPELHITRPQEYHADLVAIFLIIGRLQEIEKISHDNDRATTIKYLIGLGKGMDKQMEIDEIGKAHNKKAPTIKAIKTAKKTSANTKEGKVVELIPTLDKKD